MKTVRLAALAAALAISTVIATSGIASAQTGGRLACGDIYVVQRGDTLHAIAVRAYGTGNYRAIFDANRSVLSSVSVIEVGDRLLIPCLDGTGPQTREEALAASGATAPAESGAAAGTAPARLPTASGTRVLALSEYAPFVGSNLPEGGMISEIIARAMQRVPNAADYQVGFDTKETSPLSTLASGGYDAGYPTLRPDCSRAAILPERLQSRCEDFVFSDPIAEFDTRFYVSRGNELVAASDPGQLFGLRLCRPASGFTEDLEAEGLVPPNVRLVRPQTARRCLESLVRGAVDVVSISGIAADREIPALGIASRIAEIEIFRRPTQIRAAAPKGDEAGERFIETLNSGLDALRGSGELATVIEGHLSRQ